MGTYCCHFPSTNTIPFLYINLKPCVIFKFTRGTSRSGSEGITLPHSTLPSGGGVVWTNVGTYNPFHNQKKWSMSHPKALRNVISESFYGNINHRGVKFVQMDWLPWFQRCVIFTVISVSEFGCIYQWFRSLLTTLPFKGLGIDLTIVRDAVQRAVNNISKELSIPWERV